MKPALFLLCTASLMVAKDSCLECHSSMEGNLQQPATLFAEDIHARERFTCVDCHGGDKNADDPDVAMSASHGFRGKINRTAIPQLCARCHSDAAMIHRYKPQQRIDQMEQYRTSVHGKRLAAGDTAVATCIDCHSVHDIREVRDARAPVHPLRLPATCGRCHADAARMGKYHIVTDQFDAYRRSVHWAALSQRSDLSAPSCASCHGSHGATPPAVSSVAAVCGNCHVNFEQLLNTSPHQSAFASMGGCVVCHSNHEVRKPSSAMLAGNDSICVQCHEVGSAGQRAATEIAGLIHSLESAADRSDEILQEARGYGMEVSEPVMQQLEVRERLVRARVAVHAFNVKAVSQPIQEGLAIAAGTYRSGEEAIREKDRRRIGLAISLVTILITIAGLGLTIRAIERRPAGIRGRAEGEV